MARNPIVYHLIYQGAKARGLDPAAVLAVAESEGGIQYGNPGDNGTSFGPFQLHIGGALPSNRGQSWADSPAGINYALDQIAGVARGLHGRTAIDAIVRRFERPAASDAEVSRASGYYGGFAGSAPPVQPTLASAPSAPGAPGAPPMRLPSRTLAGLSPAPRFDMTGFLTGQLAQLQSGRFDPLSGIAALSQQMAMQPPPQSPTAPAPPMMLMPASAPPHMGPPGRPPVVPRPTGGPPAPITATKGQPKFVNMYGSVPSHGSQSPTRIVLHDTESTGTGGGYAKGIADYWAGQGKGYGVHAIIANDGTISRLVPDNEVAYHVGGANTGSLGIEIAGVESWSRGQWLSHPKQMDAVAQQIGYWAAKYGIPIVLNASKGVSTHAMQSALHSASEGHTDPGPGFPLQMVLARAKQYARQYGAL